MEITKKGDLDKAFEIACMFAKNDNKNDHAGSQISSTLSEIGNFDEAIKMMDRIIDRDCKNEALMAIICDLMEKGDLNWALKIVSTMNESLDDSILMKF